MIFYLSDELVFPPTDLAEPDGLLAVGGDLQPERLLLAYQNGIFPWYSKEEPICWWCPNPRFVLLPQNLKVSRSMQQLFKKELFTFTINRAFEQVMTNCRTIARHGQGGTWIQPEMIAAYAKLHQQGYALSAEAWLHGELAGGLYGVLLGKVFFGESMFSHESNASKFAFISLVKQLQQQGIVLIDCQMHTPHLESLGAAFIARSEFTGYLEQFAKR
jgi:leucyl/phenylalanyl-tRNA---protein transferase